MGKELEITYKDGQDDLPNGKNDGDKGRADLYRTVVDVSGETTYIWEVKPASYLINPKRQKGIDRLKVMSVQTRIM